MNLTLSELLQVSVATPVFLLLLLPAGYLFAPLLDPLCFRSRSSTEQLVWSTSLAAPLALFIANVLGRLLHPRLTLLLFLLLDIASILILCIRWRRQALARLQLDSRARAVLWIVFAAAVYLCLAGLPLQLPHRLFEPVFSSDWEIRLPLIAACLHDGVPPHNPFFTFRGQSPPMRYYYFWYSLCAQVMRLAHTDARSVLLASSVFAMLSLVATLFLYLKYMVAAASPLRQRCVLALGLCCVLGLDVVPSLLGLFAWHVHLRPEIEWWAQDRSPGLTGALLYGPHHVAGASCGLLAFLLLSVLGETPIPDWRKAVRHGVLAGIAFAALLGTSTFMLMFFAAAVTLLFLDRFLLQRDRETPAGIAAAGAVSLLTSVPYLRELAAKTVTLPTKGPAHHLVALRLRGYLSIQWLLFQSEKRLHLAHPMGPVRFLERALGLLLLYTCELGFFYVIAAVQFRNDLLAPGRLPRTARALWLLAGTTTFFFLFVTSAPVQAINDLGVHAGLLLRILLIIWGAGIVAWYLDQPASRQWTTAQTAIIRLATVCLVLGVVTAVWQSVVERVYTVLLDRRTVPVSAPFPYARQTAAVYSDIYDAQQATARLLSTEAVEQSDPAGRYQTLFRLYGRRRQAAGDVSCEGAFGGDPALCQSFVPALLGLYGSHAPVARDVRAPKADPAAMTPELFNSLCNQVGISAMLASRADPAWYFPSSWVWHEPLLYANQTVRVLACPTPQTASLPPRPELPAPVASVAARRLPVE